MSTGNFQSHQAADCSSEVLRLATETIPLDSVQVTPGGGVLQDRSQGTPGTHPMCCGAARGAHRSRGQWGWRGSRCMGVSSCGARGGAWGSGTDLSLAPPSLTNET